MSACLPVRREARNGILGSRAEIHPKRERKKENERDKEREIDRARLTFFHYVSLSLSLPVFNNKKSPLKMSSIRRANRTRRIWRSQTTLASRTRYQTPRTWLTSRTRRSRSVSLPTSFKNIKKRLHNVGRLQDRGQRTIIEELFHCYCTLVS